MIGIVFEQMDGNIIEIRLNGFDIRVRSQQYGSSFFPIKTAFNYAKCVNQYPKIKGKSTWRDIMDDIIKNRIKGMQNESSRIQYIKKEFERQGFTYLAHQKEGHRLKKDGKF